MRSRNCSLGLVTVGRLFTAWLRMPILLAVLFALLNGPPAGLLAHAEELTWPGWRGASGDGVVHNANLAEPWPSAAPAPLWKRPLGTGWSSPVVGRGVVVVTDRVGNTERVLAFDASTGAPRWQQTNPVDFDPHPVGRRHGNGPKSTAYFHDGKYYTLGIAGWLQCLDARDGSRLWKVLFPEQFASHIKLANQQAYVEGTDSVIVPIGGGEGAPVPLFGYTGSPVLAEGKLICSVGGDAGGTIMAFAADTGRVVWKSLHENVSYSSPVVATIAGKKQVVAMTGPRIVGLDLQDGKLLWSYPFQIQYDESISTPVVAGDLVLVTGDGRPLTALRISSNGSEFSQEVAWTNNLLSSYLSSMIVHDGHVFGMNDGGEFACLRLADGEEAWIGGDHGFYCTPVITGKRLLALNEQGALAVLSASPTGYQLLGENQLTTSETWTSPAVVGSRIYIRTADDVQCFDFAR